MRLGDDSCSEAGTAPPLHAFGKVLRAIRQERGLTILAAAEAVGYANYDRWEAGSTRVGAQHLAAIGAAFRLPACDLSLLIYGWLVDRLVPASGDRERFAELGTVRRWLAELPSAIVELDAYAHVPEDAGTCTDVALTCLLATHGHRDRCGHWTLRLRPAPRTPLPVRQAGVPVVQQLYGEAAGAAVDLVFEMADLGWEPEATDPERTLAVSAARLLTHPDVISGFAQLAAAATATAEAVDRRSIVIEPDRLSTLRAVGELGPGAAALGVRVHCEFRRLMEGALGHHVDYRRAERLIAHIAAGDLEPFFDLIDDAVEHGRTIPEADPALTRALAAALDRAVTGCEPYLRTEVSPTSPEELRAAGALLADLADIRLTA